MAAGLLVLALTGCGRSEPAPAPPTPSPHPSPTASATSTPPPSPTITPSFAPALLPTVAIPTPTPTLSPPDPLSAVLDSIDSRTAGMRLLLSLKPVDRKFIDRDELIERLHKDLEEDRDEIYELQELYLTLGVLDPGTSLFDLFLDMYGEGVVGFFDTEEEKLFVVSESEELTPSDALTYVHEYVHALQQQHFDIHSIGEELEENSDAGRAFGALVEGDARLSEFLYLSQHMDQQEREAVQQAVSGVSLEAFRSAPRLIQRAFIFPYVEGAQFVFGLYRTADGWGPIDRAFQDLPRSTEQILHPEKYTSGEDPAVVRLPDLADVLGEGWTELARDNLGEFFLVAYLEAFVSERSAAAAGAGWGGDGYILFEDTNGENLLVSLITWDSADDAEEFFDVFLDFTQERTDGSWEVSGDDSSRGMSLPGQSIRLSLEGRDTILIIGPDDQVVATVKTALDGHRIGVR